MARRWTAFLIALALVAGVTVAVWAAAGSRNESDKKSTASQAGGTIDDRACRIFTLADAKQLLGDSVKGGQNPVNESSKDMDVSSCSYSQDQGDNAPVTSRPSAALLARLPKTDAGIASNQHQFGPLRPPDVQGVSGYGGSAYWDAQHGQLNILKDNNWYVLSFGPLTPGNRSLSQTLQLADLLISKL